MLPGNSKLFFIRTGEGVEIDVSGIFDQLIQNQEETIIDLKNEINKWISMDLENIIKSNSFNKLPLEWKLQILIHIWFDYRFLVDRESLGNQIANLKKAFEVQIRVDMQTEAFRLAEISKDRGLNYIQECTLKAKELLVQFYYNNSHALLWDKELIEERLRFLANLTEIINDSFKFGADSNERLKNGVKEFENGGEEMPIISIDKALNKKMMILNELKVIEYLESYIKNHGKRSDVKLYTLISWITGHGNIRSIKVLMPFMRNKNHQSRNNPYNSPDLKEEIDRMFFDFNNP